MTNIAERMSAALEPLPDELLGDERARCAFYANELSVPEIMSLCKATFKALDGAACMAEAARRIAAV